MRGTDGDTRPEQGQLHTLGAWLSQTESLALVGFPMTSLCAHRLSCGMIQKPFPKASRWHERASGNGFLGLRNV